MDGGPDYTIFLGVGVAAVTLVLLADEPFLLGETSVFAQAGDKVMNALPGRTTKPVRSSLALFCAVALGMAAVILEIGGRPFPVRTPRPPPPAACLISEPGGLRPLGYTDSLENCGVQLEAVYLEGGDPVTGGYNGMRLFADEKGIDTAQPHGPRAQLIAPWMRAQIDNELHRLMRARDGTSMQISVVRQGR
jgi:hypothetical protein